MKQVLCSRCHQRPAVIFISKIVDGKTVPEVLISGHHANIDEWREAEARKKTEKQRPDLLSPPDEKK